MPDTLLGGIIINEILADPNGANNFDTDGDGIARAADEFIEIKNTSGLAIDISGLELWDAGRDNWFTFPAGTVLQPGAVAVVVRNVQNNGSLPTVTGNDLAFDANFGSGVINNNGDNIVLYDPTNDEFVQATFNGDALDDSTTGSNYSGFSATATRVGSGENFGNDQDGFSIQRGSSGFLNDLTPTPGADAVCFASGTLLDTLDGFRRIEDLRVGDPVATLDAGYQPIEWIFARTVTKDDLALNPKLHPIRFDSDFQPSASKAGSLLVSRQHRMLVTGPIAQRMFGADEILVPAKDLVGQDGVASDITMRSFRYFHVLLGGHHIRRANGFEAESFLLGREALRAVSNGARLSLSNALPQTVRAHLHAPMRPARRLAEGARVKRLVGRHVKNEKSMFAQTPFKRLCSA